MPIVEAEVDGASTSTERETARPESTPEPGRNPSETGQTSAPAPTAASRNTSSTVEEPARSDPAPVVEPTRFDPAPVVEPARPDPPPVVEPARPDPPPVVEPARPDPAPVVEPARPDPPPVIEPVRIGGAVPQPRKTWHVAAEYPRMARLRRIQGIVILQVTVDRQGEVSDVSVLRSTEALDEAAIAAVRRWRYEPTVVNGMPVSAIFTESVRFQIEN